VAFLHTVEMSRDDLVTSYFASSGHLCNYSDGPTIVGGAHQSSSIMYAKRYISTGTELSTILVHLALLACASPCFQLTFKRILKAESPPSLSQKKCRCTTATAIHTPDARAATSHAKIRHGKKRLKSVAVSELGA